MTETDQSKVFNVVINHSPRNIAKLYASVEESKLLEQIYTGRDDLVVWSNREGPFAGDKF